MTSRYLEKCLFPGYPARDFAEGSSLLSTWIPNALEKGSSGFQWEPKQLLTLWKSNCLIWSDCWEQRSWFPAASLLAWDISDAHNRINALLVGLRWVTHRGRFPPSSANSEKGAGIFCLKKTFHLKYNNSSLCCTFRLSKILAELVNTKSWRKSSFWKKCPINFLFLFLFVLKSDFIGIVFTKFVLWDIFPPVCHC